MHVQKGWRRVEQVEKRVKALEARLDGVEDSSYIPPLWWVLIRF